jgi:hypothetical protein
MTAVNNLQRMIEHSFSHHLGIKPSRDRVAIIPRQARGQGRRPVKVEAVPAPSPKQEPRNPLEIPKIPASPWMVLRKNWTREMRNIAIGLFQRNAGLPVTSGSPGCVTKCLVRQYCRAKGGVQRRQQSRRDQFKPVIVTHKEGGL